MQTSSNGNFSHSFFRAIELEPLLLDAYWHRHLLYVLQDKKKEALEDLTFILKHTKTHAGAYRSMAEIYKRQDDITMAIVNYTQAIKLNPRDHEAYFARAECYEKVFIGLFYSFVFFNFSDILKACCMHSKIQTNKYYTEEFHQKLQTEMQSEDPDPIGAVRSGSALFTQTYLPKKLGKLYLEIYKHFCNSQLHPGYQTKPQRS